MDEKAICQGDIEKLQDFFRKKYDVKFSRKEAIKILSVEKRHKPEFRGPQRPPRK